MTKFLTIWEMDYSQLPESREARVSVMINLDNMVSEDLKSGAMSDWGSFAGTRGGYSIIEGTEQDVALHSLKYYPYVKTTTVYPVISVNQVIENFKKLGIIGSKG
jgi:hypothetical protein